MQRHGIGQSWTFLWWNLNVTPHPGQLKISECFFHNRPWFWIWKKFSSLIYQHSTILKFKDIFWKVIHPPDIFSRQPSTKHVFQTYFTTSNFSARRRLFQTDFTGKCFARCSSMNTTDAILKWWDLKFSLKLGNSPWKLNCNRAWLLTNWLLTTQERDCDGSSNQMLIPVQVFMTQLIPGDIGSLLSLKPKRRKRTRLCSSSVTI